jgi:lysophospholipase L1-like esterase
VPAGVLGLVAVQGMHLRRTVLRLPEALDPTGSHGEVGDPLHLLVIGDSVAAGVGVDHHGNTLAGRLADLLSVDRAVQRTVVARSGHTARDVTAMVTGRLGGAGVIVLSVGVNDTKNLHSAKRWRQDLTELLDVVSTEAPEAPVVLLGLPPMEVFPSMPRALGLTMGARARVMDRVAADVAATYPHVVRVPLRRADFGATPDPFARDGFHPSASAHAAFAERIHRLLKEGEQT